MKSCQFSICLAFYLLGWTGDFQDPYMPNQKLEVKISCFICIWCPALVRAASPWVFLDIPTPTLSSSPFASASLGFQCWLPASEPTSPASVRPRLGFLATCAHHSRFFFSLLFLLIVVAPLESSHLLWRHLVTPLHSAQEPPGFLLF